MSSLSFDRPVQLVIVFSACAVDRLRSRLVAGLSQASCTRSYVRACMRVFVSVCLCLSLCACTPVCMRMRE